MNDLLAVPANIDAERMILGTVLVDSEAWANVGDVVRRDDFSLEQHRRIWDAMRNLAERNVAIDRVTLANELRSAGHLESVGGLPALCSLDDGLPVGINIDGHIHIVQDKGLMRRTIIALQASLTRCLMGSDGPEAVAYASGLLSQLESAASQTRPLQSLRDVIGEGSLEEFFQPLKANRGVKLVPLPWPSIAEVIPGLRPGVMVTVAARPGIGKSAAAGQIAYHAAKNGHPVAFFSLEMENRQIAHRLVCGRAEVNGHSIQCGWEPTSAERRRMLASTAEVSDLPVHMDQRTSCTVTAIRTAVRDHNLHYPSEKIEMIVIDYLQLMEAVGKHSNRVNEITEISRGIKKLAREFGIPVVALSQLSRANESEARRPKLTDLRDSGSIEQDSDIVILLHPVKGNDYDAPECEVEFIVAKHRGGPIKKRTLTFLRNYTWFRDSKGEGDVH